MLDYKPPALLYAPLPSWCRIITIQTIKHAHRVSSPLFTQILLHLLPGLWRSADLWQLCPRILWPTLWKVRHHHPPPLPAILFFLFSASLGLVIVVTGRAGSKVSKGLAVASSGFEFRWKGYKHVCGWHLLFIISVAVVIECCQWRDGSCKSVPPILMCLDVRYSVLGFCFFSDLLVDIVFLDLLNWTKNKKNERVILTIVQTVIAQIFFLLFLENKYAKGDLALFLLETFGSVVFTTFASFWLLLHLYVSPDVAFCFKLCSSLAKKF